MPTLRQAYDLYQLTLKNNPRHPQALRGTNTIASKFIAIQNKIEHYLNLAESAIKNDRLSAPENNNAAYYYRQILELEPGRPEALQGLDKLAGLYANRVETDLRKSDVVEAERNLLIGLGLQADHPRLQALAARLRTITDANATAAP